MSSFIASLYLMVANSLTTFIREERGDQITEKIILMLISIVGGVVIVTGVRNFLPVIWLNITNGISTLFTP